MQQHEILFLITALFSEIVGTVGGFGSSTFFVPLALLFEKFEVVLVLTSFLHVAGNLTKMFLFRKSFDFKLIASIALPSIIMTVIGALLVSSIDTKLLTKALGFILIFLLVMKFYYEKRISKKNTVLLKVLSGASGFLTGLFGTGGALRALALSAMALPKSVFVITSASIDLLGDVGRLIIYLRNFSLEKEHWFYIPALMVVAWVGSSIGQRILEHVSEKKFQYIVSGMILSVAVFTIIHSFQ
jgi:uncharacterized protein